MRLAQVAAVLLAVAWAVVCMGAADANAEQEKAIAAIKALGGKVRMQQSADASTVVGVDLGDTKVTNNDLVALEALPGIRTLSLRHGYERITDAGMVHLKGLAKLESIDLWDCKVSDAALDTLKDLGELRDMNLGGCTTITDEGLAKLRRFPKLQTLNFQYVSIGDAGLKYLKDLPQLQSLNLSITKVTDAGVDTVAQLKALQSLSLPAAISDVGIAKLKTMASLRSLGLRGSKLTDAGLLEIAALTELKSLDVAETKVTPEGVKKLQQALPKCRVTWK